MAFEIDFQDVDPNILTLGENKVVEVKYKIFVDAHELLKAKFISKGGFKILGPTEFNHNIGSDEEFTSNLTLVPVSVGQGFQLQLEVCDPSNQCKQQTRSISIVTGQTTGILARQSVSSKEFQATLGKTMSRYSRYKMLKSNNFIYNRSTRKWEKK